MRWELREWVKEPRWFLDVGPGLPGGEAALALAAWPGVRVLGLEPCAARYQACLPGFPGTLLKAAAWSEDVAALPFHVSEKDNLWGLFAPPDVPASEAVAGRSLDSLGREFGPFDRAVVWADIEGAELRMLQGAAGLLGSGRVLALNLEVRPVPYAPGWCVETELDAFLQRFGFARARPYNERGRGHHYDVIYVPAGLPPRVEQRDSAA